MHVLDIEFCQKVREIKIELKSNTRKMKKIEYLHKNISKKDSTKSHVCCLCCCVGGHGIVDNAACSRLECFLSSAIAVGICPKSSA